MKPNTPSWLSTIESFYDEMSNIPQDSPAVVLNKFNRKPTWFHEGMKIVQRAATITNFSTLYHPIASIYAVSSTETDILSKLESLLSLYPV